MTAELQEDGIVSDQVDRGERPVRDFPVPALRPCAEIAEEEDEGSGALNLRQRYGALTGPLPLLGEVAMRAGMGGGVHLVEELRYRMPWHEEPLSLLDRQLRVAL